MRLVLLVTLLAACAGKSTSDTGGGGSTGATGATGSTGSGGSHGTGGSTGTGGTQGNTGDTAETGGDTAPPPNVFLVVSGSADVVPGTSYTGTEEYNITKITDNSTVCVFDWDVAGTGASANNSACTGCAFTFDVSYSNGAAQTGCTGGHLPPTAGPFGYGYADSYTLKYGGKTYGTYTNTMLSYSTTYHVWLPFATGTFDGSHASYTSSQFKWNYPY